MITNIDKNLAQQIVMAVKDVCGYDINFIDINGTIFASTNEKRIHTFHEVGLNVAKTGEIIEVDSDNSYTGSYKGINIPVSHNGMIIAVIGISGEPNEVRKFAYLAERITILFLREQELNTRSRTLSEQRSYLIHALIKDENINWKYLLKSLNDMKIDTKQEFRFIFIQLHPRYNFKNISMIEQQIFKLFEQTNVSLYTYEYPNQYYALISKDHFKEYSTIYKNFGNVHHDILKIGIGKSTLIYHTILSYKTSQIALKSISSRKQGISDFDNLTLEILLGQIDSQTAKEYFHKTIEPLTDEELHLLHVYYENEMSLSKACDALYLHKNTLQYQLNRIHKKTHLNPRKFKDAVLLYLGIELQINHNNSLSDFLPFLQ